ncbi:hypothetical protein NKG94_20660 [Micromonospora sp. M12]
MANLWAGQAHPLARTCRRRRWSPRCPPAHGPRWPRWPSCRPAGADQDGGTRLGRADGPPGRPVRVSP